ncbi:L-aspartate oxidase [Candidatus Methylopumilus universalis]|uniref:L-aspartate oxidase n=1 Tax=Candidatus Methylopumilus universalis TaxID=2588536 RepID=A0AAX1EZT3_9PROT|nr:L-aspartate oxidase [Candidatus Methylopumilus universalis]QDC41319.1 L-aspartate oxidase [Candidatus Methylopumilus universalis]QDC42602.1 L-aspartate oxidase [Candidatus Methylopumilus universalis]QDC54988.1 L-aspartate oxidase [Candidatus Methylopumilus universalis]QDC56269.1 L-aspartate oxidase [Candidatus Methylopumilus universalis]QDC57558.1 L-aspartate oxidase [Candidatus Methylopumilus universalis]
MLRCDVLIIGSGLAGLTSALKLADHKKVLIVSKREILDSSSQWAQGGVAAVMSNEDSIESHVKDTEFVGGGLTDPKVAHFVASHGKEAIEWLHNLQVPFSLDETTQQFHLTKEGGHSHRRVVHAKDATGRAIQATLSEQVKAHANITILENHIAVDLITEKKSLKINHIKSNRCLGAYVLNNKTGKVMTVSAQETILAAGGVSKVYLYTTNPDVSTGDGVAMAWRAGCRVANMEFIQFHPTCLYHPKAKSFLISEIVRGEGGLLRLPDGSRFMDEYDGRSELASRDIVARAIDFEMKKRGIDCVYLDISHKSPDFIKSHFPTIYARCLELGIDITKEWIPVVPAAHYSCGGVMTNLEGQTDLAHLYAIGETAYTGLHGANRLASNSLLECLVFGDAVAKHILQSKIDTTSFDLPHWDESRVTDADEEILITHTWNELRRFMWNYVGIVRTNKRLSRALHRIHMLRDEVHEFYTNFKVSHNLIELRNLLQVAELIVESAIARHESRGLHFSRDYPKPLKIAKPTIMTPSNFYSLLDHNHGH